MSEMENEGSKGFGRYENIWEIRATLRTVTPFRIGCESAEYSVANLPVLLQYDASTGKYMPYIPGSSLKGVLRHLCTRIANTHGIVNCVDSLFGSRASASKVLVRDAIPKDAEQCTEIEVRPHCATQFKRWNDKYEVKRKNGKPSTHFMNEEYIVPSEWILSLFAINLNDNEFGLLLCALDEFNYKRAHIGGGVSRGYGFCELKDLVVKKKEVKWSETQLIKEEEVINGEGEMERIKREIYSKLQQVSGNIKKDFSKYWYANEDSLRGTVVVELNAVCTTDFYLRGEEEQIYCVNGHAVIPGSVIKGFLRHYFCKQWSASKIDDIFGSTSGKDSHASRVLVSDAISNKAPNYYNGIPKDTKLGCWFVFDCMEENEIVEILKVLVRENQITGNTAAKKYGRYRGKPQYNRVRFEILKAWKYKIGAPNCDVTTKLKEVVKR